MFAVTEGYVRLDGAKAGCGMPWGDEPFLLLPADGLLLIDGNGVVVHVSRAASEILGADCPGIGDWVPLAWPQLGETLQAFASQDPAQGPLDAPVRIGELDHVVRVFRTDDGIGVGILGPTAQRAGGGPSCSLYERVLGSLNEMVVVTIAEPIDSPGPVIVYVNDAFLRTTGYGREEVLGRSPRILQASEADPGPRRQFREKLSRWQSGRVEIDNYHKDGTKYWVEIDFSPVADETGWFTNWVSVQTVVTDRRAVQQILQDSEERYRLIAENSSDVIVSFAADGMVTWVSPSLTLTLGWAPEEWVGQRFIDFVHPDDLGELLAVRRRMKDGAMHVVNGLWLARFRIRARDGSYHWIETHARDSAADADHAIGAAASFRVVDTEVGVEAELERRARFDDLTGLLKRDEALERLDAAAGQHRRTGSELAVVFCDIDLFKCVNDTHGHAAGDELLRSMATRISGCIRSNDTVARMGGDEFLVILDGVHTLDEAAMLAEKMRTGSAEPVSTPVGLVSATLSLGVTLAESGEDADAVIARADQAMYIAKERGRNQVIVLPAPTCPGSTSR
jgi:diguanylate cyclase (GGDEF)-like protein/PAS domain S-box-containing protein